MVIITNLNNVTIEDLEAWSTLNIDLVVDADNGTVTIPMQG